MNTDRFLTRVFDKQEKKMLYSEDTFNYNNTVCVFKAIGDGCLYYAVSCQSGTTRWNELYAIRLGEYSQCKDRFVPMMCSGLKTRTKNKKSIWQGDILSGYPHETVFVEFNQEYGMYECVWFDVDGECEDESIIKCTQLLGNALNDCGDAWEVTSNIYQNEELYKKLLEGKK